MIHEQIPTDAALYFVVYDAAGRVGTGVTPVGLQTHSGTEFFIGADSEQDAMGQAHAEGVDFTGYHPLTEVVGEHVDVGTWSYGSELVVCRQAHDRTIYPPNETPALFSTYRDETGELEWIANEAVLVGALRMYSGTQYKCIQAHQTQSDWTPDVVPVLWSAEVAPPSEWAEWVQPEGAHDAYNTDDKVSHNNLYWINDVANNVWEPGVYGWSESTGPEGI